MKINKALLKIKENKKLFAVVFSVLLISLPFFVQAQTIITLPNPIEAETVEELFEDLTNILVVLGVGLLSLVVAVAGVYLMFGGDNPENAKKAMKAIRWGLIGIFVIILARALIEVVGWVLGG